MNRSRLACIVMIAALCVLPPGGAAAQTGEYDAASSGPAATSISGSVVSIDASMVLIRTDDGAERSFTLQPDVTLPRGLMTGERVTLDYVIRDDGTYLATRVSLAGSGTPPITGGTPTSVPADGTQTGSNDTMPRTASPLPLMLLIGTLSLGAGAGLRRFYRRDA